MEVDSLDWEWMEAAFFPCVLLAAYQKLSFTQPLVSYGSGNNCVKNKYNL